MSKTSGFLQHPAGHRLAYERTPGEGPAVVWLGGFGSDMTGTKAQALAGWAGRTGRGFVRFDYFGHGASSGDFLEGTITRWREDALFAMDQLTEGPLVLVGSSMGGWISCLAALARPERVAALVLVAPAADFTDKLIWPSLTPEQQREIETTGSWTRPSPYGEAGLPISRALIEDGARWSILPGPVGVKAPVRVLQGGRDEDVPWAHAFELFQAIESRDAVFTLVRDGDHRLSRPQDLTRLLAAVEEAAAAGREAGLGSSS
jgi:pimeloyl-ACP methyl ester carboxylesterase